jgi:heat shock protein HslJ
MFASADPAQIPSSTATGDLGGTSWQLVKFQGSDDTTLVPDEGSKYTIAFDRDGGVVVRADCNRGHGSWSSTGPQQIQFSPMALTRAMCPPSPLNDRFVRDWEYIRSYILKDGHLFLSLMVDGGIYEYEPMSPQGSSSALPDLPSTFTGTLPCADCPGIKYRLSINPDQTFSSHMAYEERNASFEDTGKWELTDNGRVLVLHGSHNATDKFAVRDSDTLRKLDMNGNEIESKLNYDLKREPASASTERSGTAVSLENTHWSLTRLGESSLSADPHQNEAYFVLDPSTHRVSGSGGCNRLMGSYKVDGDHLKFSQIAGSMMACVQGMETEQGFLQALSRVNTWKVNDSGLVLFDSSGKLLAQFEAHATQ